MSVSKSTIRRLVIQQEANVKECKVCKEKKLRILYGKFPSMNNKYVDEQGGLWSGRVCPPCNQKRVAEKMASMRNKRKNAGATRNISQELVDGVNEVLKYECGEIELRTSVVEKKDKE